MPTDTNFIAGRTEHFTGRDWVFQSIDRWLADPAGSRAFLLVGDPGAGKSAILARLVRFSLGQASAAGCPHLPRLPGHRDHHLSAEWWHN
jgi:hypothetical protein